MGRAGADNTYMDDYWQLTYFARCRCQAYCHFMIMLHASAFHTTRLVVKRRFLYFFDDSPGSQLPA